jgi:hypothetical protein
LTEAEAGFNSRSLHHFYWWFPLLTGRVWDKWNPSF